MPSASSSHVQAPSALDDPRVSVLRRHGCGEGDRSRARYAAGHEQIDLELGGLVNQVHAASVTHGAVRGVRVYIELLLHGLDEPIHLIGTERDDEVDVDCRARLAGKGTGDRAANRVGDTELVGMRGDQKRDGQRVGPGHGMMNARESG